MLLSKEYYVKMAKKYRKVYKIFAAFKQTFVLLAKIDYTRDCISHVDTNGEILYEHTFDQAIQCASMLSEKDAIVLHPRSNAIIIFNLEHYTRKKIAHQFRYEEIDQSNLITFPEQKLFCIEQKGNYGDNRYCVTYYSYQFICEGELKLLKVFEPKYEEWNHAFMTQRANNISSISWFKPLEREHFSFYCFDLNKGLRRYDVKTQKIAEVMKYNSEKYGKLEIGLLHVWEISQGIFFLISLTSQVKPPSTKFFVYDSILHRLKLANFSFGAQQDNIIKCLNLGRRGVFMTFKQENERVRESSIYFVDFKMESILGEQMWKCNNQTAFELCGYNSELICESYHEHYEVEKFYVSRKELLTPKDLYMHLILQFHRDIDDDLLCEVIRALQ